MGASFVVEKIMATAKVKPASTTVAVQGFGNAGSIIAGLLFDAGYTVVAVSDSKGAIYSEKGLDIPSVRQYKESTKSLKAVYCEGSVCSIVKHDTLTNEELLALDVDVLVPAALENQITAQNAAAVKARYVFEVANGPVTPEADRILEKQGITVVPDILTNAGGVTVSYFEWVQNRTGLYWSLEDVNSRLKARMTEETERILRIAEEKGCSLRAAAYVHALNRLEEAVHDRGTKDFFLNTPQ
jgi:glutamate dehydrogenase (NADP+)